MKIKGLYIYNKIYKMKSILKSILLEIKAFLHSLLSTDGISAKRAIGILGMLSMIFLMCYNVVQCKESMITQTLIDAVLYTTIAALFGTSIEKIWPKKNG